MVGGEGENLPPNPFPVQEGELGFDSAMPITHTSPRLLRPPCGGLFRGVSGSGGHGTPCPYTTTCM